MFSDYIKILRFDHWIKQIFVLPGFLFALYANKISLNFNVFFEIIISLLVISVASSCNYIINEFVDGPNDQYHPLKKRRPGAQNRLNFNYIILLYIFLSVLCLSISFYFFSKFFLSIIIIFLIMGVLYNIRPFRTKDVKYLDIISESVNNPIRFFLGYFAISAVNNFNFFSTENIKITICYLTLGCFLMSCKRLSEKRYFANYKNIAKYRITIFKYSENQLLLQIFFYSIISLLLLSNILILINSNFLIFIFCAVLVYLEYFNLALNMSYSSQEPESLYKEKILMLMCTVSAISFSFALLE